MNTNLMTIDATPARRAETPDPDTAPARPTGAKTPMFRYALQWTQPQLRTSGGEPVTPQVGVYLTRDGALDAFTAELGYHPNLIAIGWRLRLVDLTDRAHQPGLDPLVIFFDEVHELLTARNTRDDQDGNGDEAGEVDR